MTTTASPRPQIVTLCGSTRFRDELQQAFYSMQSDGLIVLAPAFPLQDDANRGDAERKAVLDILWRHMIDLADEVFVVNPGGYVGGSTRSEIAYAEERGKPVRYLAGSPS
ncbi:hypothetical protein [Microbispora triticiradicis]|uniref:hypothetical protein n=1 Tax=Microbispora triticiradicis TaxID=2200763 RepID=UPI001AD766AF|nr:hypothetical protein [Microbispora triticiradicis]MBO4273122.1 hypothetical protein [Microbispora triticiradicis]